MYPNQTVILSLAKKQYGFLHVMQLYAFNHEVRKNEYMFSGECERREWKVLWTGVLFGLLLGDVTGL